MRFFKRTSSEPAVARSLDGVTAVVVEELDPHEEARREAAREAGLAALRSLVAEGLIWQDAAEEVLREVRQRRALGLVAPRGGQLVRRFVTLGDRLPLCEDPELERYASALRVVFEHHARVLAYSLDLLAMEWRSDRIVEQLERIDGLGEPARRLEAIRAELGSLERPGQVVEAG